MMMVIVGVWKCVRIVFQWMIVDVFGMMVSLKCAMLCSSSN